MFKLFIASLLAIGIVFMLPALTGIADVLWWFWTGHTLSGIDWSNGTRAFLAAALAVFGTPFFFGTITAWLESESE